MTTTRPRFRTPACFDDDLRSLTDQKSRCALARWHGFAGRLRSFTGASALTLALAWLGSAWLLR